jgi:ADP-ribose pyrophosphatase YjhB (NUDIX family)
VKRLLAFIYRNTPKALTTALLRTVNPSFHIGGAGVFFAPDGTVLVLRHVYRHQYPWGLPAGFLKIGETPEAGVLRELREETGLIGFVEGVIGLHYANPRHLEVTVMGRVDRAQDLRLCHEIFEAAFVDPTALPEAMPPEQKEMVHRAAAGMAIKTLSRQSGSVT